MAIVRWCILLLVVGFCPASMAQSEPARFIVVLQDSVAEDAVEAKAAALLAQLESSLPTLAIQEIERSRTVAGRVVWEQEKLVYRRAFRGFAVELDAEDLPQLDRLREQPDVAFVVEDVVGHGSSQEILPGMQRIRAPNNKIARINGIRDIDVDVDIAVVDSGIDGTHPDLNVVDYVSYVPNEPVDQDLWGHGTHVSGIAAGIDDEFGIHGVAPGARLWSVKVLSGSNFGLLSWTVAGLESLLDHTDEVDVVNMSLRFGAAFGDDRNCGRTVGDPLHMAVCALVEAGVVVVVAAGNDRLDASLRRPARYDEVVTVSAIHETDGEGPEGVDDPGPDDERWIWSNFGIDVDIAAPGVDVLSSWPGGGTNRLTGTSQACPHVAGAAALWIAKNGKPRNAKEVRHVRNELVRLGFPQHGFDNGFRKDAEHYAEPLLDAGAIALIDGDPLEPQLFIDRYDFIRGEHQQARIRVLVLDGNGQRVAGLPTNAFISFVRGEQIPVLFREVEKGTYETVLDVADFAVGTYDFHVIVQNPEGFKRTAGIVFGFRTKEPALVLDVEPWYPIVGPGFPFQAQYFFARAMEGDGVPVILGAVFETEYDGGPIDPWSLLFWEPIAYGTHRALTQTGGLGLGTYHLDLTLHFAGLSASASTSFEVAEPADDLTATLTSNTPVFDFTQSVPPQDLVLDVRVEDEFLAGVPGLAAVPGAITVLIDGEEVGGGFEEGAPGDYQSAPLDLGDLAHGQHQVEVRVVEGDLEARDGIEIVVIQRGGLLLIGDLLEPRDTLLP